MFSEIVTATRNGYGGLGSQSTISFYTYCERFELWSVLIEKYGIQVELQFPTMALSELSV